MAEYTYHVAGESTVSLHHRGHHLLLMAQPLPLPLLAGHIKKDPKPQTAFLLFFNKLYSILQIGFFFVVLNCKIGMPYIYIHRYTINYNKGTEACLYQVTTGLQFK